MRGKGYEWGLPSTESETREQILGVLSASPEPLPSDLIAAAVLGREPEPWEAFRIKGKIEHLCNNRVLYSRRTDAGWVFSINRREGTDRRKSE